MAQLMAMSENFLKKLDQPSVMEKFKLDPHQGLEPARKKLTTLETERVMGVLVESYKRCLIMAALPTITSDIDEYKIVMGRELTAAVEEYASIQDEYDTLAGKMDAILGRKRITEEDQMQREETVIGDDFWTRPKSQASKSSRSSVIQKKWAELPPEEIEELKRNKEAIMEAMLELRPQLKFAVKKVVIEFRQNPTAIQSVTDQYKKWNIERSKTVCKALEQIEKLRDIMILRLMTTPSEHEERMSFLFEINKRHEANLIVIDKFEQALLVVNEHMEAEIKKKNDTIRRLQTDIHHIEKFSEDSIKSIKLEADKQKANDEKNSDGKKQKLMQEIGVQKAQLASLVNEHKEMESNLRRKKLMLETEVKTFIDKYDSDMGERQKEFEEVDAVYSEEKKQLHELEERFKTLEEEYKAIMEERRIAKEKREAEERELQMLVMAATTIQAFWRSYKVRKQARGKKGKGGKKGKKK